MRRTIKEIEVNVAYRWFLGLGLTDNVPHFTTFSKNYTRRFKDTDIFERIFTRILEECIKHKLVNPFEVFIDATHVKACANNKKVKKEIVKQEALFYKNQLRSEIDADREAHGKKPLKDKNNNKDNNNNDGNKELYDKRKETIERLFGTAKECHGFRYTNMIDKARMEMKVGITFACLNLKKLAKILWKKGGDTGFFCTSHAFAFVFDFQTFLFSLFVGFYQNTTK